MGPLDAFGHVLNFFLPAFGVGCLGAAVVKLLWRHELGRVTWRRLAAWGTGAGAGALLTGLVLFGRDGRMATYALLVLAAALAFWGAGCRPGGVAPGANRSAGARKKP